jgi:hypothetical protein
MYHTGTDTDDVDYAISKIIENPEGEIYKA